MSKADASKKILGFKYQEMVALSECFGAEDNIKIYLECFGDVSDGKVSTEVKHSIDGDKVLINTHKDFWKTLSNILSEYDTYRFYDKFVLHTTATIKKGSIFEKWEELSENDKLKNVMSVNSNQTIQAFQDVVLAFDKKKLLGILGKLMIKDGQKNYKEYYKDVLLSHPSIKNIITEENREPFICSLLGYISQELVNANDYVWSIDINSFRENFRSYASAYQIGDLKFPEANIVLDNSSKKTYRFIQALEDIGYSTRIGRAMEDYLRASDSQMKMIVSRRGLIDVLESYDEDIKELIQDLKISHIDKLGNEEDSDIKERSKRFFDDSIDKVSSRTKIFGVTETRIYYPKGRLHYNIEDDVTLNWKLK